MFGFGKKNIPLDEAAALMAQVALLPLESPSPQDLSFRSQAITAGMDKNRFTFEVIALQVFAMGAAINRERLEGRLVPEKAERLVTGLIRDVHKRLRETTIYDLLELGLDPDQAIDLIMSRSSRYSEPSWGVGNIADIRQCFAEFCGMPNSDVLQRIGWSLMQVRGDGHGEWLRKVKIV
jgi:hypothetical protein